MTRSSLKIDRRVAKLIRTIAETPSGRINHSALMTYYPKEGERLVKTGLLKPVQGERATTSLVDHDDEPVNLIWSAEHDGYGYFSPNAGWIKANADELVTFELQFEQLITLALSGLDCPLATRPVTLIPDLLWDIGDCRLPGRAKKVPAWIARGLSNPKIWQDFRAKTQTRPSSGLRVVLSLGPETTLPAAPVSGHELVAIESVANTETGLLVDANMLAARVSMGTGNDEAPVVMAADGGVITVRGQRYTFSGSKQKAVIRHLFGAWDSGHPECSTAAVLEDADYSDKVNTLGKAFSGRDDWREFIEEENGTCRIYV